MRYYLVPVCCCEYGLLTTWRKEGDKSRHYMLPTRRCGTDCVMFYITQLDIHKTVSPAASGRQHVMTTFISLLPLSDCKLITINKYVKGAATNVYTFSLLFKSKTIFNQIKFTLLSWPSATTQQRRKGGSETQILQRISSGQFRG